MTLVLALGLLAGVGVTPAQALPPWTGGMNAYRDGVFTTQATWTWCTAASVQIMRNMVTGERDHTYAKQQTYFTYMRTKNRYVFPAGDGVDPQGFQGGLRRWVDSRYRVQSHSSFDKALRAAVKSLRRTWRPTAILVAGGSHAWILHGFRATADPAVTDAFTVTSVFVTGTLWGRQNSSYGYDMPPNTRLTPGQLRDFWKPWRYAPMPMVWDGKYVQIQAVPGAT